MTRHPMRLASAFLIVLSGLAAVLAACSGGDDTARTPAPANHAATVATPAPQLVEAFVFADERLAVVDPATGTVVKEVTKGFEGARDWIDAVVSSDGRYVFVNERAKAQVFVIDAATAVVVRTIDVGARNVHLYIPNHGNELWTHSDAEGVFYVIDTRSLELVAKVPTNTTGTGHGKLRYHELLGSKYYATNTGEPAVFVLDGKARSITKVIEVCKGDDGKGGTHGKAYSPVNYMAYFECSGTVKKLAVVDTRTDTFVKYLDTSGQIFEDPSGRLLVVANKAASRLDIVDTGTSPEKITPVAIQNGPDRANFATIGGRLYAFTANVKTSGVDVIDLVENRLAKSLAGPDLVKTNPTLGIARNSDLAGGYFVTLVKGEDFLTVIDVQSLTVKANVTVPSAAQVVLVGAQGIQH